MRKGVTIALLGKYYNWIGGIDFLRQIINGFLARRDAYDLTLYLLLPVNNRIERPLDLLRAVKTSLVMTRELKRPWFATPQPAFHDKMLDFLSHLDGGGLRIVYYENSRRGLIRCLQTLKADVAFPASGALGENLPVPGVGFIYDFQHKYLSGYFTPQICLQRDIEFATTLKNSKAIIVHTRSVKDDLLKFFPYLETEIFSMPFAPSALPQWFESSTDDVRRNYELPEKYFLISNQFWEHKDHMTAFRAMARLADFPDVSLVCTGTMEEPRRPSYIFELNDYIAEKGLTNRVRLLGHIPKQDQIGIMRGAVALVQPTLFEGSAGGGCTHDAVALGVPVILSDIPVNREADDPLVRFFRAGDCEELAAAMRLTLAEPVRPSSIDELIRRGKSNQEKLGDRLLEAVSHAL